MGVKLVSSGGGSVEINPPATASSFTATMPAGTGNVVVNGVNGALVAATAVASTSGTSIDFTGIPSWVRRITVMFNGVSTNGTSIPQIQLGVSGTPETTGYSAMAGGVTTTNNTTRGTAITTGFPLLYSTGSAIETYAGSVQISLLGSNIWTCSGNLYNANSSGVILVSGAKTLAGTLNMVRITTVNGTDTFDAGTINIMYE